MFNTIFNLPTKKLCKKCGNCDESGGKNFPNNFMNIFFQRKAFKPFKQNPEQKFEILDLKRRMGERTTHIHTPTCRPCRYTRILIIRTPPQGRGKWGHVQDLPTSHPSSPCGPPPQSAPAPPGAAGTGGRTASRLRDFCGRKQTAWNPDPALSGK